MFLPVVVFGSPSLLKGYHLEFELQLICSKKYFCSQYCILIFSNLWDYINHSPIIGNGWL